MLWMNEGADLLALEALFQKKKRERMAVFRFLKCILWKEILKEEIGRRL